MPTTDRDPFPDSRVVPFSDASVSPDPFADAPRFPNPFASPPPPEPVVRFVPDPLAGPEYAVRSQRVDTAAVVAAIRGALPPSDWRWDGRARCPYVALWAVDEAAEELRRHGFEVRVNHRPPADLDGDES